MKTNAKGFRNCSDCGEIIPSSVSHSCGVSVVTLADCFAEAFDDWHNGEGSFQKVVQTFTAYKKARLKGKSK